ncbi:MAG: VanW family protein [Eubacteriales bacterium]|nr:VanW family protein [Eubacteriales bacterium]
MRLRRKLAAAFVMACVGIAAASAAAGAEETIGQGVYINDMDVSGLDYAAAQSMVEQRVQQIRNATITVQVGEDSVEASASDLGLHWENKNIVRDAVEIGNSGNPVKRYKDEKDLARENRELKLEFSANENAVREFIEENCMQFEKEPQEATITSDGSAGFELVEGVTGQVINVEESVKAVQEYIAGEWQGGSGTVALSVELEEPKGDTKDLETIQDLLGTYTTYYGSTTGRNMNVERGAELINGHVIYPGETFSVCDHLVPFNAENGYELAPEYSMGQVVQGYGGGICQVSTTLYNALLQAELEIVERHCHTMTVSYVEPSMDAAIAEGAMDLVFRNNLDTPIFISGYAYGGVLTFSVYGKETRPADRTVYYYSVTTSQLEASGTILTAVPEQAVGYLVNVQAATGGLTAECWKSVTENGQTTDTQVNSSVYEASPARYEVGTAGASDAFMSAVYSNDLATVQAAIYGGTASAVQQPTVDTTQQTDGTAATDAAAGTGTTDTAATDSTGANTTGDASQYIDTTGGTGQYIDTTDGEVYVGGSDSGVVTW